ncbi:zinc finger protein 235-like [Nylanderia fulva]|uniref:zinc finger protein 235-like n=1 Tax=Nylanderia fulva TaxID=613905 RepID=UPI0010FB4344|nr:zinc finger protein 235-like [Nylanderia fulva]
MKIGIRKITIDKQLSENKTAKNAEVDEKLSLIDKGCRKEDVFYKKLANGNYICNICQTVSERKSHILSHIMGKHSFHRSFRCAVCGKNFKYNYNLNVHRLIHEKMRSDYLYGCSKCNYRGGTKAHLKAHYTRRHTDEYRFVCEHCGKYFKLEWDLKFHLMTHDGSWHMCDICGRFYTSNYSLYKHRKMAHLNEYKFHCDVCNKKLIT